jgi:pSer/pThr/pTyr-binding forkhead associated (FHA) protein
MLRGDYYYMDGESEVKFLVCEGLDGLSEINILSDVFIIGSSNSADATISSPYVSRRHFQLRRDSDVFWISDLGSRNGTSLNGTDLPPHNEYAIKNEDIITLAKGNVVLQFMEPSNTMNITSVVGNPPRTDTPSEEVLSANLSPIYINTDTRKVYVLGVGVSDLSRQQDDIAGAGWPERPGDVSNAEIDQYIRQIRVKVEEDPSKPRLILTRRGHGYMIP